MRIEDSGIEFSKRAVIRAAQRGITWDMVKATIYGGRHENFGKNMIKFKKDFKRGAVICVGEWKDVNRLKIITIELGR